MRCVEVALRIFKAKYKLQEVSRPRLQALGPLLPPDAQAARATHANMHTHTLDVGIRCNVVHEQTDKAILGDIHSSIYIYRLEPSV